MSVMGLTFVKRQCKCNTAKYVSSTLFYYPEQSNWIQPLCKLLLKDVVTWSRASEKANGTYMVETLPLN